MTTTASSQPHSRTTSFPPTATSTQPPPHFDALKPIPEIAEFSSAVPASPCPAEELEKMWAIFQVDQDAPISIRALQPKGSPVRLRTRNLTFNAADFPDITDRKQAFSDHAIGLNNRGYLVYVVMNPINSAFAGDMHNDMAVSDPDIASRRLLLIDLDRTGRLVESATEEELNDAADVADSVTEFLKAEFEIETSRVMSGNGWHVYLPLANIANDSKAKDDCQRLLAGLARQFDTETVKVDQAVYNASRITKVPGTIARKGSETPERPFRMAVVK